MEIKIKKGYGEIIFGTPYNQIVEKLGIPSEIIDSRDDKEEQSDEFVDSLTAFFDEHGLAMFFEMLDEDKGMTLQSIEIDDNNALMFNENIFNLRKNELIKFLEKNLKEKSVIDDDKVFEEYDIIDFENNGVSLLFEDDSLVSITLYNV